MFIIFWILLIATPAVVWAGQTCMFSVSGSPVATYCELGCCDNTCCGEVTKSDETQTIAIVVGVLLAVILAVVVIVLVIVFCKHKCPCYKGHRKKSVAFTDNAVKAHDDPEIVTNRNNINTNTRNMNDTFDSNKTRTMSRSYGNKAPILVREMVFV